MENVVALFAGAGGLSRGFADAGIRPKISVEIDGDACATYERNLGVAPLQRDISSTDTVAEIIASIGKDSVDAVIGGPPCQGFSTAGGRWARDPRNQLIFNYFGIVDALQPRWFLFENVEGLLTSGGGHAVVELTRAFIARGYSVRINKVNLAAYGLPQTRKRVIIVGNRLGFDFDFPAPTHSFNSGKHRSSGALPPSPSLHKALAGLGNALEGSTNRVPYRSSSSENEYDEQMRRGLTDVSGHFWSASENDKERFRHLLPGQTMKDLPERLWHSSFKKRAFRRVIDGVPTERRGGAPSGLKRLKGELNSLTITGAATREFIHPVADRPLTLREAARLQSFPDDFEFTGNTISQARQIGNAVPPMCARVLAEHLRDLNGKFGSGSSVLTRPPRLIDYVLTEASGMSPALRITSDALAALAAKQLIFDMAAE